MRTEARAFIAEFNKLQNLMIGPTDVGKTEISRRLARLAKAPFIKVEATKFTEVGYVGREVDSIIREATCAVINSSAVNGVARSRFRKPFLR